MIAENYGTRPPRDNEADADGNSRFYGFEAENMGDGRDPWPAKQLDAIERASAAVCRAHRWQAKSVIGHLEWQPGKIDPRGFAMPDMRSRIAKRLSGPAKPPTAKEKAKLTLASLNERLVAVERKLGLAK